MLQPTPCAVSAFPEDDVRSSHLVCVYNGSLNYRTFFCGLSIDSRIVPSRFPNPDTAVECTAGLGLTRGGDMRQRLALSSGSAEAVRDLTFTDGVYAKGTRACAHRELLREWLWEPNLRTCAPHLFFTLVFTLVFAPNIFSGLTRGHT